MLSAPGPTPKYSRSKKDVWISNRYTRAVTHHRRGRELFSEVSVASVANAKSQLFEAIISIDLSIMLACITYERTSKCVCVCACRLAVSRGLVRENVNRIVYR